MLQDEDKVVSVGRFLELSHPKIRKKFNFMISYLREEKNMLCEPYVKHFGTERYKELYEIRLKAARTMVRIIFYMADSNIILLHAFFKHDRKDTENALEYALKLLNRIKENAIYPFEKLTEVG